MRIGFAPKTREVVIVAAGSSLRELADAIMTDGSAMRCSADDASRIRGYPSLLRSVVVSHRRGMAVVVRVLEKRELLISGDPEKLSILSENIATFSEEPPDPGAHLHIEYFPGHYYLAPDSDPLVVSKD